MVPLRPTVVVDEGGRDGAAVAVEGVHVEVVLEAEDADRVVLRSQDQSCSKSKITPCIAAQNPIQECTFADGKMDGCHWFYHPWGNCISLNSLLANPPHTIVNFLGCGISTG